MSSSQVLVDYLFPLLQLLFFGYHLICNEQSIGISTILFKYILLSVSDPNVFYLWFRHLFISQVWSLDYDILNYWGTVQRVLEGLLTFSVFWVYFIFFFFLPGIVLWFVPFLRVSLHCSFLFIPSGLYSVSWNKNREYRRGNQKWTIQRNWQHRVHKTKKDKAKTQHNQTYIT